MKAPRFTPALASLLLISGCANDIEGPGAFAEGGGGMARSLGMNTAGAITTGVSTDALVGTTARILAKYQATAEQRRVAQARARKTVAVLKERAKPQRSKPQRAEQQRAESQRAESQRADSQRTEPQRAELQRTEPQRTKQRQTSPSSVSAGAPTRQPAEPPKPAPLPRYIAVDTKPDKRSAKNAEKSIMIWDTQAGEIVGNNVYDIQAAPAIGASARFDTYSAEYVGAGL